MLYRSVSDRAPRRSATLAPFDLLRWFAILGGVAVALVAAASGLFLARFVERSSIGRDAVVMTQLVNNVLQIEQAESFFQPGAAPDPASDINEFLAHLGRMPGVLRANAFALDRTVLWSTDSELIGRRLPDNDELTEAFEGQPVAHLEVADESSLKAEQTGLVPAGARFVENYLPVRSGSDGRGPVIGAIEIYRSPPGLFSAIDEAVSRIVAGVALAALLLYAALFAIVWRGMRLVRAQAARLVEAERLAVTGEMASAVAHGLRNPLASMRSSAELCLIEAPPGEVADHLADIVTGVDRLEGWIRQYLSVSRPDAGSSDRCDVAAVLGELLATFDRQLERSGVAVRLDLPGDLPAARINAVLFEQIVNGLVANALEAMTAGGELRIAAEAQGRELIRLRIEDTGTGMTQQQLAQAFEPFTTSKPAGLGLGLTMAREALERQGARLDLASAPGRGTVATLRLPATAKETA